MSHSSTDTDDCSAFFDDSNVITIKSSKNVLSNFYPCGLRVFDTEFKSSEQSYQWRFAQHTGITCTADEIMAARSAADAKDIAARIPRELQRDWHSVKCEGNSTCQGRLLPYLQKYSTGKRW